MDLTYQNLTWIQDLPKRPGFYWWRFSEEGQPEIVEITTRDAPDPVHWQVDTPHGKKLLGLMHGEWSGRLQVSPDQAQTIRQSFRGR